MKGVNDTQILMGLVIFLSSLAFVSAQLSTNIIEVNPGWNASYVAENETVIGSGTPIIPAPPVCTQLLGGYVPIIGDFVDGVACLGGYLVWLVSLMFIDSSVQWLYALILMPTLAGIGFIIVRLIRSGGG